MKFETAVEKHCLFCGGEGGETEGETVESLWSRMGGIQAGFLHGLQEPKLHLVPSCWPKFLKKTAKKMVSWGALWWSSPKCSQREREVNT
jgi:hypothetical protein